ncbi:MAG: DUF58 domain-containing protein [Planctomycetota bacterium]
MKLSEVPRLWSGGLELAARRMVEGLRAGRHRSPSLGPAAEFHDHRAYMPGDDLRSVDWKAYARSDRLLLRRHREERDLPLVLLVDTSASMDFGTPTKRAWATLAAATLAVLACDQGDRVRLVGGDAQVTSWHADASGPAGAARVCHALDQLVPGARSDVAGMLMAVGARLERRALVVLLSDLLCEPTSLGRACGALSARGHEIATIQIHDPAEAALPAAWGSCMLTDPEGVAVSRACDTSLIKAEYDVAWRRHLADLAMALAASRVDLVSAPTDRGVADVLGGWLHRRTKR